MNEYQQKHENALIRKLVSNARAIITNQISIALGSQKMEKIRYWIKDSDLVLDVDLQIFTSYYSEIQELTIGTERLRYNRLYLKEQDEILDRITLKYKEIILDKCFEIINNYTNNNTENNDTIKRKI